MEKKRNLTGREKAGYGLGAVAKDMVYMLSASYVLYYFQDIMGVNAFAMGVILLVARIFDAFNDPIMGVIVAKTRTRMGKFRPWLLIGTMTNAVVLYLMFACPPALDGSGLIAYAAVTYILWGVTYTMMDIPFWSMIPAFTRGGKERENLTTLARSCSGVGSALVSIFTVMIVHALGTMAGASGATEVERLGFRYFSLIVAVIFVVFIIITVTSIKENPTTNMETASIGDMFRSLVRNDQAMAIVVTIVLVDVAMYITSNLVIYFFKYDLGGTGWYNGYTLFNTVAGAAQILSMMILYPLLRQGLKIANTTIFYAGLVMSMVGYGILLAFSAGGAKNLLFFLIPGVLIMAASGMNNVLITIFLANTVDYGEIKNHRRDESVIFSMQTFVVKLSSGIAALVASITLGVLKLSNKATTAADQVVDFSQSVNTAQKMGLRLVMTLIPAAVLVIAFAWFRKRYKLNDKKVLELADQVAKLHETEGKKED
ncbi:MAG: glycoside-pentoside-hexuronide (GPH):cation symporter [Lachnospiraceae bacterium]|nr:glycoside-pentoside-hexuronide (GPH):cation symporter [Lachnospiraceae bacterium]MDD6450626.1 glycoside-pentoside-hexuronide (GPH):cation symporter [Lachnospiraceae bacterium]